MQKKTIHKTSLLLLSICWLACISACNSIRKTKKFNWNVSACQPEHFPSKIYRGSLHYGKKNGVPVPYGGILKSGWGSNGTTYSDATLKALPHQLDIAWMSYRENKFYGGSFKLPVAKMEKLFEEGFLDIRDTTTHNVKRTYTEIIVGVGPGGLLGVWLSGVGNKTQVATFYGEETHIDFRDFNPSGILDRDLYVSRRKAEVDPSELNKPIPFKVWETYAKTYIWKPVIRGSIVKKAFRLRTEHYNGNAEFLVKDAIKNTTLKPRTIPSAVIVNWEKTDGKRLMSEFYFNEQEILDSFETRFKDPEKDTAEFIFEFKIKKDVDVFLKVGNTQIPLKHVKIDLYKSTF